MAESSSAEVPDVLQFQPLSSVIHISFWQELSRRKLEIFRLSRDAVPVCGSVRIASDPRLPGQLEVSSTSFDVQKAEAKCHHSHSSQEILGALAESEKGSALPGKYAKKDENDTLTKKLLEDTPSDGSPP